MAAPPLDLSTLNRVNSTAVGYWRGILIWAVALTVVWFKRGPDHSLVALLAAICTFTLTPGVAVPVVRRLPGVTVGLEETESPAPNAA